jgi:hypothetical protein
MLYGLVVVAAPAGAEELDGYTIYAQACASCHAADGRGSPTGTAIKVPLPDFTDCSFTTREPTSDWSYVTTHGGAGMGLSNQMPSFRGVLSDDEIEKVLDYIRGFCTDDRWPRGELNFRRPLFTSKAFPESEAVLSHELTDGRGGDRNWVTQVAAEARVGPRGQVELVIPFVVDDPDPGATEGGVGDLALSYKHVLYASLPRMTIASASLEVVVPSGDRDDGLGDGTVKLEPSLHFGKQIEPLVFQGQIKGLAPIDEDRADRGVRYHVAASYPLGPLRRDWWPTLEFEALQNVTADEESYFLTPQVYKAIRKRGHVAVALGVQVPVGGHQPFDYRLAAFLLWEYRDGGLWW